MLDFGRIVLALLGKSDLALLEFVEDVTLGDRTQAHVFDLADGRLFLDVNVDDPAFGGGLPLDAQIVEVAGVPQGIKVALQGRLVVNVTGLGEHSCPNGFRRNPAIAMDNDALDHALLRRAPPGKKDEGEKKADHRGPVARPASEQDHGSYLKMARNDETSVRV